MYSVFKTKYLIHLTLPKILKIQHLTTIVRLKFSWKYGETNMTCYSYGCCDSTSLI